MIYSSTQCQKREYAQLRARSAIAVSAALVFLLLPEIAAACDATDLFGTIGSAGRCDPAQTGVFATILCFFETALESMLGSMYCTFQERLQGPIAAAFGIAIALFGVCVLSGYLKMKFNEAVKIVAKLALVAVFALNSDYAIEITGKLFMGMLQSGTQFVLNPLGGSSSLTRPDSLITGMFNFMSDPSVWNLGNTNNCGGLPCMNDAVLKIISNCAAFLAVLGIALAIFLPVVIAFIVMLLIQYLALYVKSLLSYLTSIVIITFLLILTPLFVSFALFSATAKLFEQWLMYLRMFSIQGIILFAFLAMLGVITQGFTGFLYGILRLLRPIDITMNFMLWTVPITNCSICEYKIEQLATGSQTIQCQPAVDGGTGTVPVTTLPKVVTPDAFPPRTGTSGVTNAVGATPMPPMPNGVSPATPITYDLTMGSVLSSKKNDIPGEPSQHNGWNYVIPITNLLMKADFILYVAINIIAFGIVASLFQEFIGRSTDLAKKLGGVSGGGGFGGHADEGGSIELAGQKAVAAGLKGMEKEMLRDPLSSKTNILERFKNGVFGRSTVSRKDFNTEEGYREAKKGDLAKGGFLGALMYGASEDGTEEGKEYDLKLAQRRVDDAALKLRETREATEASARTLSDALDAKDAAEKKGNLSEIQKAREKVAAAKTSYDISYEAALKRHKTFRNIKQELRDAEFDMRQGLQDGLMPVAAKVIEPAVGAAALFASSKTLDRANKKYAKHYADPNSVAASSGAGRPSGFGASGRSNSSDEIISAQQEANEKLKDIDEKMERYGRFFNETERAEHKKTLESAKAALGNAKTEYETFEIMKGVKGADAALDRFSDRNVMQGVAVAGVAALGAYLFKASGIVPTAYLQETQKFLDGANKKMKEGEAGAASVAHKLGEMPKKVAQSVVDGAQGQASMAARIVPEDELSETKAKIDQAEADLQSAKDPSDYLKIIGSLEGLPQIQLAEVLDKLGFQRSKAEATLASAVAMPRGWEGATHDSKREYIGKIVAKVQEEVSSTSGVSNSNSRLFSNTNIDVGQSGLRSAEENEAHKKELDTIKDDLATASTEEEFKQILQRAAAVRQSVNDSVFRGSPSDVFSVVNQKLGQAQTSASSARTGDDHNEVLRSLLSVPQHLNQSVISVLQEHTQKHNSLIPEHLRQKMETELAQASIKAQRAVTGKEHDDLLTSLGKSFVGGGTSGATIAMTQWDRMPTDKKREEAEKRLASTKETFEGMSSKLPEADRKAYEEELNKASTALASATDDEQMRTAVAQTISIGTVLKESAVKIEAQQNKEDKRRAREHVESMLERKELTPGGATIGEMNLASHVMLNLNEFDSIKATHKQGYGKEMLSRIEGTYTTASTELSGKEKEKYEKEMEQLQKDFAAAKTEQDMRGVVARAAAMEGSLLSTAQNARELAQEREEEEEDTSFEDDGREGNSTLSASAASQATHVYDGLDDGDKERVQRILARNPELTLQQAITQMNDAQALNRRREKQEQNGGKGENTDKEKTPSSKSGGMSQKPQQQEQKRVKEDVKKKTRDNLSSHQREKIRQMMAKHPGMTVEQAIMKLNMRGKLE